MIFLPTEKTRNFNGKDYQKLAVELELGDINRFGNQYVQIKKTDDFPFEIESRIGSSLGQHGETIIRTIKHFGLIQGGNSSFRDRHIYNSYQEYFNEDRKRQSIALWRSKSFFSRKVLTASLMLRRSGFVRQIDAQTKLVFDDLTLETRYDRNFRYPEEWESEFFSEFEFEGDCYATADDAIANLKPEFFATTTVAILTIPKSHENACRLRGIPGASAGSSLIVHGDRLLKAVRFEDYPAIIYNIYDLGGAVYQG